MDHRTAFFRTLTKFRITATEIANRSGLSKSYISQYKDGKNIGVDNFFKLFSTLPPKAKVYYLSLVMAEEMGKWIAA